MIFLIITFSILNVCDLSQGVAGTAYLACDDEPITREEICASAIASGQFPGLVMPKVRTYFSNRVLHLLKIQFSVANSLVLVSL